MDEHYLLAAVRYTELNPVRAGLCDTTTEWRWSSVHAHLSGEDDDLVTVKPMLERISNWSNYLGETMDTEKWERIRKHCYTGRPLGNDDFIDVIERKIGRCLRKQRPGPKSC